MTISSFLDKMEVKMRPISFKEQNRTLKGKVASIKDLPVYTDEKMCISCWRLCPIERFKALIFGKIWVQLRSGGTQHPMALICSNKGFEG